MRLLDQFRTHGGVHLEGAFSTGEAAAMRDAVWGVLSRRGFRRDNPATWKEEQPVHLQELKDNPVFRAPWSKHTIAAIDEVMGGAAWQAPKSPGAHFIAVSEQLEMEHSLLGLAQASPSRFPASFEKRGMKIETCSRVL